MAKTIWRTIRQFVVRRVLHADDTPHRIALGVAVGVFVGFTPLMGIQTIVALSVAAVLRANKAVSVPFVWITNPFTFVPVYYYCWKVGTYIVPGSNAGQESAVEAKLHQLSSAGEGFFSQILTFDFWAKFSGLLLELGGELWIGCTAIGVLCGAFMYLLTLKFVVIYRLRREHRRLHRRNRSSRTRSRPAANSVH